MKAKKVLLTLLILILMLLSAFSCGKHRTEDGTYYRSLSPRKTLQSSMKISLKGQTFHSFLSRGRICVSQQQGDTTYYGVLSDMGETILPTQYTALTDAGDFLVAEGVEEQKEGEPENRNIVFSRTGKRLYSSVEELEVTDVGGGYFSVKEKGSSYLINPEGRNALPGTLLDDSYIYTYCGDFAIAKSTEKGSLFIFDLATSSILYKFFNTNNSAYSAFYVGGRDFIVICNERVQSSDNYSISLSKNEGTNYYRQSIRRYTAGIDRAKTLSMGHFVTAIYNKYSFGLTEEDREEYSLKEGYHAMSYYVTEGKKASGALSYAILNSSLREVKELPEGVSSRLTLVDGIAAASSNEGAILFLDEKADVVGRIDDNVYQNIVFSGEIVTASKVTESGSIRLGGFDLSGRNVIPFEYSYISVFVGGKAVATKEGKSYIVNTSGEENYIGDYTFPHHFDGFYELRSGDTIGAASYDGTNLIAPDYTAFVAVRRYGSYVYAALSIGSVIDVYRLY